MRSSHREYLMVMNSPIVTSARYFVTIATSGFLLLKAVKNLFFSSHAGRRPCSGCTARDAFYRYLDLLDLGIVEALGFPCLVLLLLLKEHQDALHTAGGHFEVDVPQGVTFVLADIAVSKSSVVGYHEVGYWFRISGASSPWVTISYCMLMFSMLYDMSP